jgi:hypothetical protein
MVGRGRRGSFASLNNTKEHASFIKPYTMNDVYICRKTQEEYTEYLIVNKVLKKLSRNIPPGEFITYILYTVTV